MSLKERIDSEIKTAMKAKDKDTLRALRSIKSLIMLAETEKGGGDGLTEDAEMKLLTKAAKQRKDSLDIYQKEGRADLAEKEASELAIIEKFLPEQLSDEEIEKVISEIITQTGAESMKDMGKVMGMATKQLAGKADAKKISEVVKAKLA
ncbi:GatB/YqeY domain-containing protein [Rapidithrix thailandica]|uniref:GatB/YqeY domain-containing protein n=1 Tax=Rapidithrix thailandica TaxID=413964 RepID=A0AAW9S3Q2_9BACT